jgi:hypothetical protein
VSAPRLARIGGIGYDGIMTTMIAEAPSTFVIDEYVIEAFTCGDCWRLALAMRECHGLPIAFFAGVPILKGRPFAFDSKTMWCHVFNALPDGRFIDVTGISTGRDIHDEWDDALWLSGGDRAKIVVPTEAEVSLMLDGVEEMYPEFDTAIVAKHLGSLLS